MNVGNRVLWSIVGLVLLAAGVLGVMASQGWLAAVEPEEPLVTSSAVQRWNSWGDWATAAVIAAGLLLVVLGVLLLRAELRGRGGAPMNDLFMRYVPSTPVPSTPVPSTPVPATAGAPAPSATATGATTAGATTAVGPVTTTAGIAPSGVAGHTQVASSALNHALVRDLESDRRVRHAAVRIVGKPAKPHLLVRLSVTHDVDMTGVAGHLDRAVSRFARTSGLSPELAEVTVKVADRQQERVH